MSTNISAEQAFISGVSHFNGHFMTLNLAVQRVSVQRQDTLIRDFHSILHGSEGGSSSSFVDPDVVCRHTVLESNLRELLSLLHQTVGLVLKLPAQGFQLDCDTVPTVHIGLCRLQVSIRFPNLSNLCVAVLCDASSQFIFTLELAPQRLNLLGIWHIGVVQQLLRLMVFAAARNHKLCHY